MSESAEPNTTAQAAPKVAAAPAPAPATSIGPIPVGSWVGIHDQEMPTLARLAVYDRGNDTYIFANKVGILVRQLTRQELMRLVEEDLVDILERRTPSRG